MRIRFYLIFLIALVSENFAQQATGAAYTCLGPLSLPTQNIGFINAMYSSDEEANLVYAGSLYGGLWKGTRTAESGTEKWTWKNITDTWPKPGTGVNSIIVMPNTNSQVIYIGTQMGGNARMYGYSNGILKTVNGGQSWKQVGPAIQPADMKEVDYLENCPDDPMIMLARIGKELFYTNDGWKTYSILNSPIKNQDQYVHLADVEWKPGDKKTFYITTRSDAPIGAEFYKTTDEGKTWEDMLHGVKAGNIQIDVINRKGYEDLIYMMYAYNGGFLQLYDGKSWSANINTNRVFSSSGYWHMQFEVNEEDTTVMYFGMTQVSKSTNGGRTFVTVSDYWGAKTHADVRDMKLLKGTKGGKEDVLAMANDGGISVSLPGAMSTSSWKNINGEGLGVAQFWGVGTSEKDRNLIRGGGQDNGLYTYDNGVWKNQTAGVGDGYDVCISDVDVSYAIGQGNSPSLKQTKDRGSKWGGIEAPPGNCHLFRRPMQKFDNAVWIGHHQLFKMDWSTSRKGEWIEKSFIPDVTGKKGEIMNDVINCFGIADDKNTALMSYAGAIWQQNELKGKLFFTKNLSDEKPEWKDITKMVWWLDWRDVVEIHPVPEEENSFYVMLANIYHGWQSELMQFTIYDDSVSMKDLSFNLPKPRSRFVVENTDDANIYVATDTGIYVSNKALLADGKWLPYFSSENPFPFCTVSEMEINYASNRLYIATYGRGMWYTPLAELGSDQNETARSNSEWKDAKKIKGELIVAKKKTLTISAPVYLAGNSKVILKKRAKLIIKSENGKALLMNNDGSPYDISKIQKGKNAEVIVQ